MVGACSSTQSSGEEEEYSLIPPGKSDNFYSDSAMEYLITGTMRVELTAEHLDLTAEEQREKAIELAQLKTSMLMAYLNEYVIDKSEHSSQPDYGGLHAMARAASFEPETVVEESPGLYAFQFTGEVGGSIEFLDLITQSANYPTPEQGKVFEFGVPSLSTDQLLDGTWKSSYSLRPSSWNPAEQDASVVEYVPLTITPEEIAKDAFIDYNALFADGVLTIGIHFGYDYNEQRYDLQEAEQVYDKLKLWGFTAPADSFEALGLDSGPFIKTIKAQGRDVRVEITLIHDQMVDPVANAAELKGALIESFTTREVILFNGHAGFSGRFLPANWQYTSAGNISSEEMWAMDLPTWYQVVLVNGCDTYGKFADNFRLNPAKQDAEGNLINVDVVTSTSFAWLSQMGDVTLKFVQALTGGYQRDVSPITWDRLLTEINWGVNSSVFFGVHGIDDNPRLHPYANSASQCAQCDLSSECGSTEGNKCIKMVDGVKYCAMKCLDDSACPTGMTCQNVANASYIYGRHCVPTSLTCTESQAPPQKALIINELLFDPAPDMSGDANNDGVRSAIDDEFVEILNISDAPVDLSGYSLADSISTRFTFPEGFLLEAGGVAVVFGGGAPSLDLSDSVHIFTCTDGLGLNNSGDTVFLSDQNGDPVDSVTYGDAAAEDRSLVRSTDGDPEATFIPHPGTPQSPGLTQGGASF